MTAPPLGNGISARYEDRADTAQVIVRPPLPFGLAIVVGLALDWLVPLPFMPAGPPAGWLGTMVFLFALALAAWAIVEVAPAIECN